MWKKMTILAIAGGLAAASVGCDLEDIEDVTINIGGPSVGWGGGGRGGRAPRTEYVVVEDYYYTDYYVVEEYSYGGSWFDFGGWWW